MAFLRVAVGFYDQVVWQYRFFRARTEHLQSTSATVGYVFLQLLDLMLSILAMWLGLSEVNPFMRNLLATPVQLLTVKLAIPLLVVWLVPGKLLIPAILFLSLVVGWNIKELLVFLL